MLIRSPVLRIWKNSRHLENLPLVHLFIPSPSKQLNNNISGRFFLVQRQVVAFFIDNFFVRLFSSKTTIKQLLH